MRDYLAGRDITALTGVMADKDYTHMYATMAPLVSRFVTVTPDNPRAMAAEKLREILLPFGKPVTACASVAEGVEQAIRQAGEQGLVLAFGSLYLVGDVRKPSWNILFNKRPDRMESLPLHAVRVIYGRQR